MQLERRGVAVLGAPLAPCRCSASPVTYSISSRASLHERLQGRARLDVLAAERIAGDRRPAPAPCAGLRTSRDIPAGPCRRWRDSPSSSGGRGAGEIAEGLLPVETFGDGVAFQVVAAGEAEEGRVHVGQLLHQVDAVAVGAVVDRWAGTSETRLSQTVPGLAAEMTKRLCGRRRQPGRWSESPCTASTAASMAGTLAEA